LSPFLQIAPGEDILMSIQFCLVLEMGAWAIYLLTSGDPNFNNATGILRRPVPVLLVNGIGQLFPFVAITGLLVMGAEGSPLRSALAVLTGMAIIIGSMSQKTFIILGTGFLREMVLSESKKDTKAPSPLRFRVDRQKN
jgi:hypothetical protein